MTDRTEPTIPGLVADEPPTDVDAFSHDLGHALDTAASQHLRALDVFSQDARSRLEALSTQNSATVEAAITDLRQMATDARQAFSRDLSDISETSRSQLASEHSAAMEVLATQRDDLRSDQQRLSRALDRFDELVRRQGRRGSLLALWIVLASLVSLLAGFGLRSLLPEGLF